MPSEIKIRVNNYHDSMLLMQINHRITDLPGVKRVAILMATEPNKKLLLNFGFVDPAIEQAGPSDMVIGLETVDQETQDKALALIERLLTERVSRAPSSRRFATLSGALGALPEANLALISTPGQFAAREAKKALDQGLNVFIFSDNVPLEEEIELKRRAADKSLLVMGPDCGTAIIDGVGIGFANQVGRGPVGVIGAAGSGIQELTVLLDHLAGVGISQAIGLGGRDLSAQVQGTSARQGLAMLAQCQTTRCIVLVSKPPSPEVAQMIARQAAELDKPVVLCFLGQSLAPGETTVEASNLHRAENLEQAALEVLAILGRQPRAGILKNPAEIKDLARQEAGRLGPGPNYIRGIYSGGSLCYEALTFLRGRLEGVSSNLALQQVIEHAPHGDAQGHCLLDMGADEYTQGRVHPMIDPSPVAESIVSQAADPQVAVILFDVVLGYGAHQDPAAILVPALEKAMRVCEEQGRHLAAICHVCGTKEDQQDRRKQEDALSRAGAITMATNLQAVQLAAAISQGASNGK